GRMRLSTRSLYVPSAPRFLARKTSAIPPMPSRRMTSKSAKRWGRGRVTSLIGRGTLPQIPPGVLRGRSPSLAANGCPHHLPGWPGDQFPAVGDCLPPPVGSPYQDESPHGAASSRGVARRLRGGGARRRRGL